MIFKFLKKYPTFCVSDSNNFLGISSLIITLPVWAIFFFTLDLFFFFLFLFFPFSPFFTFPFFFPLFFLLHITYSLVYILWPPSAFNILLNSLKSIVPLPSASNTYIMYMASFWLIGLHPTFLLNSFKSGYNSYIWILPLLSLSCLRNNDSAY